MSSGLLAHGTVLIWNFQKVLELSNMSISESKSSIKVSSHDSPEGWHEYIAGMGDGGEISLEGNSIVGDTKGQIALHTDKQAGTKRYCYIVPPMSHAWAMEQYAIVTGFGNSFPMDDKISLTGTLKVSGKPLMYLTQSTGISALSGIEQTDTTALEIAEDIAAGTYAYTCTVDTASDWVKLTVTAASHTIYADGVAQTTTVQGDEITLGAAGTTTDILIMVFESTKSPRLYKLTVTRPAA